jgi:hypothetical protein
LLLRYVGINDADLMSEHGEPIPEESRAARPVKLGIQVRRPSMA